MIIDLPLYDYQMFLNANKSKVYQERTNLRTKILVEFLLKNNLLINLNPYDENNNIKTNLIIFSSNLSKDGFELFKKAVPNWYRAHDRGTPIEKVTILEKALAKIRANT